MKKPSALLFKTLPTLLCAAFAAAPAFHAEAATIQWQIDQATLDLWNNDPDSEKGASYGFGNFMAPTVYLVYTDQLESIFAAAKDGTLGATTSGVLDSRDLPNFGSIEQEPYSVPVASDSTHDVSVLMMAHVGDADPNYLHTKELIIQWANDVNEMNTPDNWLDILSYYHEEDPNVLTDRWFIWELFQGDTPLIADGPVGTFGPLVSDWSFLPQTIPEPATGLLVVFGAAALLLRRRWDRGGRL